jgi:hypothetical protein
VTARGSNPPAPSATYLLIVNPTVLCRAVILLGDRRIAAGTVRLSCPARERAAGATHRAVGFTINFCFRGMRDAFGVYCTEQHRRVSKVSSLLLAGSLWVRLTLSPACFVLWDARHACTPPRYAHFSPTSIRQHTRFSTGQNHASENEWLAEVESWNAGFGSDGWPRWSASFGKGYCRGASRPAEDVDAVTPHTHRAPQRKHHGEK